MLKADFLKKEYEIKKKSVRDISLELKCSENTVTYWLNKHKIKKRTISEAIYQRANPLGDPFKFTPPKTTQSHFLYGLGLGLFWGEGNKVNKHCVRLGNADPALVKIFIEFLVEIYKIDKNRLRFGLQIFSDISPQSAVSFWTKYLNVPKNHFYKVIVTPSITKGTYRKKSQTGVVTVYFSNSKLRDSIINAIEELREGKLPS